MSDHTRECDSRMLQVQGQQLEWQERWPRHCRSCQGWGGQFYPGGRFEPADFEPCSCIEERGECPRCGGHAWNVHDDDDLLAGDCPHCGWSIEKPDGLPEPAECICEDVIG